MNHYHEKCGSQAQKLVTKAWIALRRNTLRIITVTRLSIPKVSRINSVMQIIQNQNPEQVVVGISPEYYQPRHGLLLLSSS